MSSWLLLGFLAVVWCLWAVAAAAAEAVRAATDGRKVHGVSILPVIPFYPLVLWGVALLIDRAAAPWGTRVVAAGHAAFAVALAASIIRDRWRLRRAGA